MDLLVLSEFLDRITCERIVESLKAASGAPAVVYGTDVAGAVHANVRSATRVVVPDDLRDEIAQRFEAARQGMALHFGVSLSHCEEPQFLHYRAGDFFVAHQDGNTPLTRDETRHRRVSVVVFLNSQSAAPDAGSYGGGDLLFHGAYPDWQARHAAPAAPGALVAFHSEATHEVTPVTHGDRYTIVSWYRERP